MSTPTERVSNTLIVYVLANAVVTTIGIIVCLGWNASIFAVAVGTSVIASGLVGLLLAIVRYLDERDGRKMGGRLDEVTGRVNTAFGEVRSKLDSIGYDVASLQLGEAKRVRVVRRGPKDEIKQELEAIGSAGDIWIDVAGYSLKEFWEDFNGELRKRVGPVHLRLLMMDPRSVAFQHFCNDQNRDEKTSAEAICATTSKILAQPVVNNFDVAVRWDPGFQSVTMTKVHDTTIFVRSRLLDEKSERNVFFEVYHNNGTERLYFDTYNRLLDGYWKRGIPATEALVQQVRSKYAVKKTSSSTGSYLDGN